MGERVSEVLRFAVVGTVATAVHYAIYYLLLSAVDHNVAYTTGYAVSFLGNYVLTSLFTFRVRMTVQKFVSFCMSHLLNYLIGIVLLNVFVLMGLSLAVAPLPVFVLSVPLNYLLVRYAVTHAERRSEGYVLFLLAVGMAMLWLNFEDVPTLSDDMVYRFQWQAHEGDEVVPITSLGDLLHSQQLHYMLVNGRLLVHTVAQAFLAFVPPVVLQIVNAALFVVLLHLLTLYVHRPKEQLTVVVVACFLLTVVFQGFRTAIFWSIGSFNYLWVLVATMLWLLWVRRCRVLGVSCWVLSPLALVAGWSHEAISLPLAVAGCWVLGVKMSDRWRRTVTPYILFYVAGTVLCLLSPGILNRSADAPSFAMRLLSGGLNYIFNVRVVWLLLALMIYQWFADRRRLRAYVCRYDYGFVALAVSMGIVLLCGSTLERVAFYTDFIAMLLLLPLLVDVAPRVWLRRLTVFCSVVMLLTVVPAYIVRHENKETWQLAEKQMKTPGREVVGVRTVVKGRNVLMDYMRDRYVQPSFEFGYYCCYMAFDCTDSNIRCAARLSGKERLVFLPADVLERIEHDSTAYADYELDSSQAIYVWRLRAGQTVNKVTFVLNDEDPSELLPHQRLLAYDGNRFELDPFRFETVEAFGRRYLVFTRPTTKVYRRIHHVELE